MITYKKEICQLHNNRFTKINCDLLKIYSVLGKKWSLVIFYQIEEKLTSFNELKKITQNKISDPLLSKRLKDLEKTNLILKTKSKKYRRTEFGEDFAKDLTRIKETTIKHKLKFPHECRNSCIFLKH